MAYDPFSLVGLFISGFVSSTLLPGSSELVLFAMLQQAPHSAPSFVLVATLGNSLGGWVTWWMGRAIAIRYPLRPLAGTRQQRGLRWLRRWGGGVLLFSWLPVIGDVLCLTAGWLKLDWRISFVFILIGKLLRYIAISYAVLVWVD